MSGTVVVYFYMHYYEVGACGFNKHKAKNSQRSKSNPCGMVYVQDNTYGATHSGELASRRTTKRSNLTHADHV
eukprot:scaffold1041_cov121-Cylindrotheca_fusiformis.AAC.8